MKKGATRKAIYRKDYAPYPWNLDNARLRFEIDANSTRVVAQLDFCAREPDGEREIELALVAVVGDDEQARERALDLADVAPDVRRDEVDDIVIAVGHGDIVGVQATISRIGTDGRRRDDLEGNVLVDQVIVHTADGDGLRLPPVVGREGDGAGGASVVDGDLIATADGDGDV